MTTKSKLKAIKKYQVEKVKLKQVAFYLCDYDILKLANSLNFQAFVKAKLKEELKKRVQAGMSSSLKE